MDIKKLIEDYTINNCGLSTICEKYKIGKLKAKSILTENGVEIKKKGKQPLNENFVVTDFHIKKYEEEDGYHYIAVDKNNGITYNDYMNNGGFLTTHIKNVYGITTPSLYDRRLYYMRTGNYWWEQWFNIIKEKDNENVKKCPYCDWTTIDLDNKSGAYTTHILSHGITIKEHLENYPEDKDILKKQNKLIEREKIIMDDRYFISCPICGERLKRITLWHLKSKHNMSMKEFREKYPKQELNSYMTYIIDKENFKLGNLVVSKDRFVSKYEKELQDFLTENNIEFKPNRQILIGKEIDILIENKKIGIEFNGLKWHTEWFSKKDRYYHVNKTNKCNKSKS